jgi:hypothetical protein
MVGGLFGVVFVVGTLMVLAHGLAVLWLTSDAQVKWLDTAFGWGSRIAMCDAVWFVARRAAHAAESQGPSSVTILVCSLIGLAVGVLVGLSVHHTMAQAESGEESFFGDVGTQAGLIGYAVGAFCSTFLSKKRASFP